MQTKDAVSIEVAGLVYRYRNAVQTNRATSEFQDDITGNLIRQILGSFDGYQSRENAKQTVRAMQENARQGFCNGSVPHVRVRDDAAYRKEWAVPVLCVCGLCPGRYDHLSRRGISMAAVDGLVLEHLADRLFIPERIKVTFEAYITRSAEADGKCREQPAQTRRAPPFNSRHAVRRFAETAGWRSRSLEHPRQRTGVAPTH